METALALLRTLEGGPAYALVFGLLLGSGFFLPVNEDVLLVAAAALSLAGVMQPLPLVAVAWCGILAADLLIFHWGRRFGAPLLAHRWIGRWLPPARLQAVQARVQRWGPPGLALVRFAPGFRTALLLAAGSLKMRYAHLLLFDGLAGLIEIPALVWAVRAAGGHWN